MFTQGTASIASILATGLYKLFFSNLYNLPLNPGLRVIKVIWH